MQPEQYVVPQEPSQLIIDILKGHAHSYTKERVLLPAAKHLRAGFIPLSQILAAMKSLRVEGTPMVSCFDPQMQLFVYLGTDPSAGEIKIPLNFLQDQSVTTRQLLLRLRFPGGQEKKKIEPADDPTLRTKDRKICYIIEKVALWRNLYNGTVVVQGDRNKLTLEEASLFIGISKKSLDDYLLQLRFGRRHGFNFQMHNTERVGLLRSYVKRTKHLLQQIYDISDADTLLSFINRHFLGEFGTETCQSVDCCRPTSKTILSRVQSELQKTAAAHLMANGVL